MGWERKRGLINQFNDFLLGKEVNFKVNTCENFNVDKTKKQRFIDVKYVITLDSDTTLTLDSAFRLIGTIDHILNRPVVNKIKNIVVDGHGIIQPRIGIDVILVQVFMLMQFLIFIKIILMKELLRGREFMT